jgi:hypothetical protein
MSIAGVAMDTLTILKSQLFQIANENGLASLLSRMAIEKSETLTPRDLHHVSCKRTTFHGIRFMPLKTQGRFCMSLTTQRIRDPADRRIVQTPSLASL